MSDLETAEDLREPMRAAWHRYLDALAPLRPALHGYCHRLTGNLWDAEDLVQDALLRAFGRWGVTEPPIRNPRAYLLRTATNVWIDTLRRRERESLASHVDPDGGASAGPGPDARRGVRDAGERLLRRLSPQERAAVVLKEVFEMRISEIAELLATTEGAVKSALHRGRERLREPEDGPAAHRPRPSEALLDRFIERYEAGDVDGLVALMLEGGTTENVGNALHIGVSDPKGVRDFLWHLVHGHEEWPEAIRWESARMERAELDGEPVVLYLVTRRGHPEQLVTVLRFEQEEGRIARVRSYGFCPETIREIGRRTGRPVFTGLYRAPDASWR